jgi:4-hydroxy-tetrahydrodipicolinate synthase
MQKMRKRGQAPFSQAKEGEMKRFQGIFTVMLTAYDSDGKIDRGAMKDLTEYQVGSGVHGLVVLGSNGECPYLTPHLQRDAIDIVVESCAGKVPVIVGINERGTEQAVEMANYAEGAGADGLLIALPLFYPLEWDSVFEHYETISRGVNLPILFYNWPANTQLKLSPESIARLGGIENVVGAKETIFDVEEVRALVDAADEDFCVFTGMTLNLVATMEAGACGAICPLPNVIPETTVALYEAIDAGDSEKAAGLQNQVFSCAPLLASSATPHAMMKEAVRLLGHPVNTAVKGPMPRLSPEQADTVRETLKGAELIPG